MGQAFYSAWDTLRRTSACFTPDNRLYAKNDGALELRLYNIFLDRGIDSLGDFTVYLDNKQGLLTVIYQIRLYIITL